MQVVIVKIVKKMMMNCRVWWVKVKETVSDKALEDLQGEFDRSIDKVQHTEKSD